MNWEDEWRLLMRRRDEAEARAQGIQAAITAVLRRREPLPMQLLRAADAAEADFVQVKAALRDFLHHL